MGCWVRRVSPGVGSAIGFEISGAGSTFRVGQRAAGGIWSLFFGAFLVVLASFCFGGGLGILWGLGTFLMFPNFLGS